MVTSSGGVAVSECLSTSRLMGGLCPSPAHFGAIMPETLGKPTPPSPTDGAGAQKRKARLTPETDIQQRYIDAERGRVESMS